MAAGAGAVQRCCATAACYVIWFLIGTRLELVQNIILRHLLRQRRLQANPDNTQKKDTCADEHMEVPAVHRPT